MRSIEPAIALRWADMAGELAGVGYWQMDAATQVIRWSPNMFKIFGLSPEAIPSLDYAMQFVHPDDRAQADANLERNLLGGSAPTATRIVRPTGEIRHIEGRDACEFGPAGEVLAIYGTVHDVTDRRIVELALAESEARYRATVENVSDVISRAGADGRFSFHSGSIRAVTGYAPDELIGISMVGLIHPDDRVRVIDAYRQIIAADAPDAGPLVFRVQHKNGHWISIETTPTVMRDDHGRAIEFLSVTRDVSARVKLESDLRAASDAALAASATKSEFLANMSHEIRTPLTAILGFTSLLNQRTDFDAVAQAQLERISRASEALLSIVNDVLDFSKLEAAHIKIKREPASIVELVNDVLAMFEVQTDAKGLQVALRALGEIPSCLLLDAARVRQILLNLVGNAVKFTEQGLITVAVRYDAAAMQLAIDVSDTGCGLSEAEQARLFQRFSQIDASSTRRHGGTGLGLAICKGLVEAMDGEIGVASKPGLGATFSFRIAAAPSAFSREADSRAAPSVLHGMRVLVADDNSNNRDLVRAMLAAVGAEITEAADGALAVAEATSMPFDIILMDIRMPVLDGPAALEEIRRADGPNRFTPIVAFSADVENNTLARGAFDGVVRKPMAAADLLAGLAQCLPDPAVMPGGADAYR